MKDLIIMLAERDIKRLLVCDDDNKVINIITQSSIVDFLWSEKSKFGEFWDQPLSKFECLKPRGVISINEKENLINAFKLLRNSNVTAICVVNDNNELVGTVSVKDLRTCTPGLTIMQRLYIPVKQFINKVRIETKAPRRSIICSTDDDLGSIIEKLHESRVHRVWIVENNRPIGIVSIKDLLTIIYNSLK